MSDYPILKLKKGKEVSLKYRHPWVFSGALDDSGENSVKDLAAHGSLVRVADFTGAILGTGTFSNQSMIAVRIFDFNDSVIDRDWILKKINEAFSYRQFMGYGSSETTGFRLCFSESDSLPGLIVDKYEDILVLQISTKGMEQLKPIVIDVLREIFSPSAILEKSEIPVRNEEGLKPFSGVLWGKSDEPVVFKENGLKFTCDPLNGQKTGFFMDQKDLRSAIGKLSAGRAVLNLFSYTGSMAVYALINGAKSVLNVDGSDWALEECFKNAKLNKIKKSSISTEKADIFAWLTRPIHSPEYDMVIVDPPAIIKTRGDIENGKKAYHFLYRAAMRLVKDKGIFVASSCSHYLSADDLRMTLHRAAVQNNLTLRIIGEYGQSADHPVALNFSESGYLKSLIGLVERR